ncbi:hypothetical protein ACXYTP_16905 [Tsukamurella ocularis]|uniref:hypothetical protein n=1 Tax=Tsukamurella ocularis TaxID=1970234 RepID=UPI0039F0DB8F
MSVRPPAPGRYQQRYPGYPQYRPAITPHGGFLPRPYAGPYAPIPPRPRPAADPGRITAVVGLVMFFVLALPIFALGTMVDLNPTFFLPATMSTLFLSIHAFSASKRHGHTNAIAVVTMILCMMLLTYGLVSTLLRLLTVL